MSPVIHIENLSKNYKTVEAIRSISFAVEKGELFGVIGPDGAGKTSLFRIIATLLLPASGKATVLGFDSVKEYKEIRSRIGYMPGRFSLYPDLSVEENLTFFATIFGTTIRENYHLVKDIYSQIEPFRTRKAGKLSGGMKQKLALSCALIHKPELLILDEPTTGVDAVSRKEFWEMLQRLKSFGITIIVSTPYMDEAKLCDRVALMQNGSLMSVDSPEGITAQFTSPLFAVRAENMYNLTADLRKMDGVLSVYPFGQYLHVTTSENVKEAEILSYCLAKEHVEIEVKRITAGIEDCFISLMKKDKA
jgi:ABC-type multidrug transport system ATPase subunit